MSVSGHGVWGWKERICQSSALLSATLVSVGRECRTAEATSSSRREASAADNRRDKHGPGGPVIHGSIRLLKKHSSNCLGLCRVRSRKNKSRGPHSSPRPRSQRQWLGDRVIERKIQISDNPRCRVAPRTLAIRPLQYLHGRGMLVSFTLYSTSCQEVEGQLSTGRGMNVPYAPVDEVLARWDSVRG